MTRRFLIVAIVISITVFSLLGCGLTSYHGDRRYGDRLVESAVKKAEWSKDGKAVFFLKYPDEKTRLDKALYRFDVATGKTQSYPLHLPIELWGMTVSPDEKKMVYAENNSLVATIHIVDLRTGRIANSYKLNGNIFKIYWHTSSQLLFSVEKGGNSHKDNSVYTLEINGKGFEKIIRDGFIHMCSADGTTFIYEAKNRYYVYDLTTKRDRLLSIPGVGVKADVYPEFYFVSKQKVIYEKETSACSHVCESLVVNLTESKWVPKRVDTPPGFGRGASCLLSPDMSWYCYIGPIHQDTVPESLYLVDIPKEIVKKLKN